MAKIKKLGLVLSLIAVILFTGCSQLKEYTGCSQLKEYESHYDECVEGGLNDDNDFCKGYASDLTIANTNPAKIYIDCRRQKFDSHYCISLESNITSENIKLYKESLDKNENCIENKSLVFSGPTRAETNIENFKQTGFSEKE